MIERLKKIWKVSFACVSLNQQNKEKGEIYEMSVRGQKQNEYGDI